MAASTQQPKKNGWTLHFIKSNFFEILKRANHQNLFQNFAKTEIWKPLKHSNFVGAVVGALFKVFMIFTWKMKRCKTECGLDQTCNLHCGSYSQPHWLTDWLAGWPTDLLAEWLTAQLANDWLTDWLTEWLTSWPTDLLNGWLTDWLTGWLID